MCPRGHKSVSALPILKTSAKSVQTTAEVCTDYTCSLYRLQLKSPELCVSIEFCFREQTLLFLLCLRFYYNFTARSVPRDRILTGVDFFSLECRK